MAVTETISATFDLPSPPSTNELFFNRRPGVSGKNGRKLPGRGITKTYAAWKDKAGWDVLRQRTTRFKGPVTVDFLFQDEGRTDPDNRLKACLDLLVWLHVIEDDNPKIIRRITIGWSAEIKGCRVMVTASPDMARVAA